MTQEEFDIMCMRAVDIVKRYAPVDTGNLKYNAIRFEWHSDDEFVIYVNEDIAHYMKYTNESWDNFRPPLQGKKNPNEGWWERSAKNIASWISTCLNVNYEQVE